MTYIISNANLLFNGKLQKISFLVKRSQVVSVKNNFNKFRFMQMDLGQYLMTPSYVFFDQNLPVKQPFPEMKEYFINHFILKGCTTVFTLESISYEYELINKVKRMKAKLAGSPIDFVLGVKIPLNLLTVTFIRHCKKEKIPALFIEITKIDELFTIPWGWIREAMFPYNSPLIPVFQIENTRDRKQAKFIWSQLMKQEKLPFIDEELTEHEPLPVSVLKKTGIYPLKSYLHQGGEVSYNLYLNSRKITMIEELDLFHYHNDRLLVTVHKGNVIRAGSNVFYRPGFGEDVTVKTPSYFISG
ncbi:hypothetical protein PB1_13984 [Bacillus methanolicus PB1]|uniref:Uncharacterized protein n=1 Tax=Bacillus methanolicus PB1 TaxID=997296 RepID=I3DWQ2_BACMT|nr:hypothetical protein [Bacillus methanolicus]EIJ78673.1 hypothetical protein PB1_13984 [Bacillus methanolicus PB1]